MMKYHYFIIQQIKVQKYEILRSVHLQENKSQCKIIAFNNNSSIIAMDLSNKIKMYRFNKGQLHLLQVIDLLEVNQITHLQFLKQSNQFVLGSEFGDVMLWYGNENLYYTYQFIRRRNIWEFEDLIIQSRGKAFKFYEKQQNWNCTQKIQTQSKIMCYSINQSSNMLVSACQDHVEIFKIEKKQLWMLIQTIHLDQWGYRICIFEDDFFAFQPNQIIVQQFNILSLQILMFHLFE
ncbi:unnamed protein product [Paramecium octaurelia]|uniref:WD40-repeat-containing domain n=1 Tax=Paramecium octaurelia TaxID=43137 RepID=A0A8S1YIL0_PAROT|nr:unnamed protein product [Paramecium octaurelia]